MKWLIEFVLLPSDVGSWQALALEVVVRVTLVLLAAALACVSLGRASASVRHLVWASAVTAALAMPVLSLTLPAWRLPVLPVTAVGPSRSTQSEPSALSAVEAPLHINTDPRPIEWPPVDDRQAPLAAVAASMPAERSAPADSARSWARWIAAAWGVGAVAVLVSMLVGQWRLWRLNRRSRWLVDGPWIDQMAQLGSWPRRPRPVVLLEGDGATSPMTWGVLRPRILVPAGAEEWPPERLRAVLLHELAHVTRRDCLTQMLAQLACAVYWFHPLAWLAARRLRIERERACDDLVIEAGSRAADYAGHLLAVARALRLAHGLSAVPMARRSQIEGRLRAILDGSRDRRVVSRRGACLLIAAVVALILPLSSARLGARPIRGGEQVKAAPGDRSATMIVTGRVFDPAGRPAPGAWVAVVGRRKLTVLSARADDQHEALGRAQADAEGRFRLETPRTSSLTHYEAYALALAPGFGLGWTELNRDAESLSADVKLRPEQVVEGRLVSLQGAPAAGVEVRIASIGVVKQAIGDYDGLNFHKPAPEGLKVVWPQPLRTDADGRFRLAGIGRGLRVGLEVADRRFARQWLRVETDLAEGPRLVTLPLQPALQISGRLRCADSGEPLRGAIVEVGTGASARHTSTLSYRADADGRYEANPAPGKYLRIVVYPPLGSPYMIFQRDLEIEAGATLRVVDLTVPRGVLIAGRITERGGRPLAGASVYYMSGNASQETIDGWMAAVPSGPDGRYAIAVAPGKGQILVHGPTADFVHEMRGGRELVLGKPGGQRLYAHAFVPYEAKPGRESLAIDVSLQPGVTLAGRVVGPDGRAVERAEIITTLSISPFHTSWRGDFTIPVRDGRFELHGLPPSRPVKCSFLDSENGLGATIEVTAAMAAAGRLTVKLAPCGTATARIVDEQGRGVAKNTLLLALVASPGPGIDFYSQSLSADERDDLAADEEGCANIDRRNYWAPRLSDAVGRVSLPNLIPGATYRFYEYAPDRGDHVQRWRDFSLSPGQTLDLGNIRVKTPKPS